MSNLLNGITMNQENIIEGNKLIAEFMGLTIITDGISLFDTNYRQLAKYQESWKDLMPVVENISRWADVNKDKYNEYFWREPYHTDFLIFRMEINELWLAVVEFIKWYNANKEK